MELRAVIYDEAANMTPQQWNSQTFMVMARLMTIRKENSHIVTEPRPKSSGLSPSRISDLRAQIAAFQELMERAYGVQGQRIVLDEGPTTACWSCGKVVPVHQTWTKRKHLRKPWEQRPAYCEGCKR